MPVSGKLFHLNTKYSPEDFGPFRRGESLKGGRRLAISVELPGPCDLSIEKRTFMKRRSRRKFSSGSVTLSSLSTVLWFSLGVTGEDYGFVRRTFPSAGALYPTEGYVVVELVEGLEPGIYRYDPFAHVLHGLVSGNFMKPLAEACLYQEWISGAQFAVVLTSVVGRMTSKYGDRGFRYIYIEAGHVGQSIYIVCEALGLGTCAVGAFFDDELARLLGVDGEKEVPLYVFPVGRV